MLRLIKFTGSAADAKGQPLHGVVGVTFALYADQQGGSPLWLETQNVTLDNQGRYTALLGAGSNDGLPLEIFASGEARWLGITVQGQPEQPRVLLVAVPYALKAADAETLGGLPPSSFVLAAPPTTSGTTLGKTETSTSSTSSTGGSAQVVSGTTGRIAKFTAADAVGDSALFEDGSGRIGLGTTTPTQKLQVAASGFSPSLVIENQSTDKSSVAGFTLQNSQATDAQTQWLFFAAKEAAGAATGTTNFQIRRRNATQTEATTPFLITGTGDIGLQAGFTAGSQTLGNVGIGTRNPTQKLDVIGNISIRGAGNRLLFPDGSSLATATGLGDITAVNTAGGSGLTGGVTSGAANLSLLATCSANQVLKWNGSAWACAADNTGGAGTITAVNTAAGSGLTGGATSGDVNLSLLTSCTSGQVLKWSGTQWQCSNASAGGTVTSVDSGLGLTGGPVTSTGTLSIDTAVVPQLGSANVFTTGPQTLRTGAAATNGLIVRGAASQTANLQEWQNSASTPLAFVNASGGITAANFTGSGSALTGLNASNLASGLVAAARGGTGLDTSATATGSLVFTTGAGTWGTLGPGTNGQVLTLAGGVPSWGSGGGTVTSVDSGTGLTGGPITTSGSLSIDTAVVPQLGSANVFTTGPQTFRTGAAATNGLIVRGAASQTANLQEWQNSAANPVAAVGAAGDIAAASFTGNGSALTGLNASNLASGLVAAARGGTGLNTAATAGGSLLFTVGAGAWSTLTPGSNGQVLTVSGGLPAWATPPGAGTVTSVGSGTGLTGGPITTSGTLSIDTAVVPRLGAGNTFTTGNQSINTGGSSNVGLIVKGAASQTANLQQWRNSSNVVLASLGAGGTLSSAGLNVDSSTLWVDTANHRVGIGPPTVGSPLPEAPLHVFGDIGTAIRFGSAEYIEDGGNFLVSTGGNDFQTVSLFSQTLSVVGSGSVGTTFNVGTGSTTGNNLTVTNGNFTVTGGTKSAVVPLADGRQVKLYAMESPQNWFEDFGGGQLHNGAAVVTLDPTFAQTVDTQTEYRVFLTPQGDCHGLYVTHKTPGSFEVHELGGGRSSVGFDYRIIALRRGYENVRLEEYHPGKPVPPPGATFASGSTSEAAMAAGRRALVAPPRFGQPVLVREQQ